MSNRCLGLCLIVSVLAACTSPERTDTHTSDLATLAVLYDSPEGWAKRDDGPTAIFTTPEGNASLVVVPVARAANARDAAARAWRQYDPTFARDVRLDAPVAARNGWDAIREIEYETSPAEEKLAYAFTHESHGRWQVVLLEGHLGTIVKRGAAARGLTESFAVAGYQPEKLAGRKANALTPERVEVLRRFVEDAATKLLIPGVGLALVEEGDVVFEGGVGVKDIESRDPVTKNTLFMIASNTKGMTTLLLAKLVEMGKMKWDDRVIDHYPEFRLGDDATTRSVLVRHLVCACTGLPRKDFEWIFGNDLDTPPTATFDALAATSPTSDFGELYQYNNQMASAAGYVAGYVLYPDMEIGAAYDYAMQTYIFDPLGMHATTFSMADAQARDHARPYARSLRGHIVSPEQTNDAGFNHLVVPYRPAGAAWSSVHDVIKYVRNELSAGVGPDGHRLFQAAPLLERRKPGVATGKGTAYGMGLSTRSVGGINIVEHGGSMIGYKSNLLFVPDAGVGAVILTNSEEGYNLTRAFTRRLVEVLYDAEPQAERTVDTSAEILVLDFAKRRDEITLPADETVSANLASAYVSEELGELHIRMDNGVPVLDPGVWKSEFGTKQDPDGSVSLVMTGAGLLGLELIVGDQAGKRTLAFRDDQHSYLFVEAGQGGL